MSLTLKEVLPREFMGGGYVDSPAMKHCDVLVTAKRIGDWPGREKFVTIWYVLANGYAVGWNENTSRGWSFPVFRYKGGTGARG